MSKFLTALRVLRLEDTSCDGRGTWQLLAPLAYESDLAGRDVIVPPGFKTDFASVPRVPVAFFLTGGLAHEAAVVHDWLYTTHLLERDLADGLLREAAAVCGVASWRCWLMYWGVRLGGARAWNAGTDHDQPPRVQTEIAEAME